MKLPLFLSSFSNCCSAMPLVYLKEKTEWLSQFTLLHAVVQLWQSLKCSGTHFRKWYTFGPSKFSSLWVTLCVANASIVSSWINQATFQLPALKFNHCTTLSTKTKIVCCSCRSYRRSDPGNPYRVASGYSFAPATSANDSEISSDALTDDSMSMTDSSV